MFLQHELHDLQHGVFLVLTMQHKLFLRRMKLVQPVNSQQLYIFRTQEQMALKLVSTSPCSCSQPVQTIISFRSPPVQTTIIMSQYLHNPIYWIKTLTPKIEFKVTYLNLSWLIGLINENKIEELHIVISRLESLKGTMPIKETYLVSTPWQKARRWHHVTIMYLLDSSQHNNAGVDSNISIKKSSTFHLQLASLFSLSQFIIITKHHDPVIQVPITSNHVDNRFCCITTNRHVVLVLEGFITTNISFNFKKF